MVLVQPQGGAVGVRVERTFAPSRHRHLFCNIEMSHERVAMSSLDHKLAFEYSQKDGTSHCSSESRLRTRCEANPADPSVPIRGLRILSQRLTPGSQRSTRKETSDDGVPRIFLLPVPLDGTVETREQSSPDPKVSSQDRCSSLDCAEGTC
jgi:hypothetical protein